MRTQIAITMYNNIKYSLFKTPISERDYSVRPKLLLFLQTHGIKHVLKSE